MRIAGLIVLGLLLLNGITQIIMNISILVSGEVVNAPPGYMASRLMSSIAITALIAFFFFKLLKKTD